MLYRSPYSEYIIHSGPSTLDAGWTPFLAIRRGRRFALAAQPYDDDQGLDQNKSCVEATLRPHNNKSDISSSESISIILDHRNHGQGDSLLRSARRQARRD